jgi:di/tripeptidase
MKYASKVFKDSYMNERTFNVIFDRLTSIKTPFKSYMIDAEKFDEAADRKLSPEDLELANTLAPGYIKTSAEENAIAESLDTLIELSEMKNTSDEEIINQGQRALEFLQTKDLTMKMYQKSVPVAIASVLHAKIINDIEEGVGSEENQIKSSETEIAKLRAREQEELRDAIPNIADYPNTYADAASTTGSPTFTNTGGYKIYKFTGSGSITF